MCSSKRARVPDPSVPDASSKSFLRRYYDEHARHYDGWMASYDRWMLGDGRARLCARAAGRTLEVAVGTGLNLRHYPDSVEVTGVDYSPEMLAVARRRAAELGRAVALEEGDAHHLAFRDGSFDTVVTTLFLSSAPDPVGAASEMFRVLAEGGRLLCIDHVRSERLPVRLIERGVSRTVLRRTGVDLRRNPLDYLAEVGFALEHLTHAKLGFIQTIVAGRP